MYKNADPEGAFLPVLVANARSGVRLRPSSPIARSPTLTSAGAVLLRLYSALIYSATDPSRASNGSSKPFFGYSNNKEAIQRMTRRGHQVAWAQEREAECGIATVKPDENMLPVRNPIQSGRLAWPYGWLLSLPS